MDLQGSKRRRESNTREVEELESIIAQNEARKFHTNMNSMYTNRIQSKTKYVHRQI